MANLQFSVQSGGQFIEVKFRAPRIILPEQGVITRVITGNEVRDIYRTLQAAKLPSDKGPYADKDDALANMAWEMKKMGRGDLESEIKWLVQVLMPRFILEDENMQSNTLADIRTYKNIEFLANFSTLAYRDHERIMNAGELLTEPEIEFDCDKFLQLLFQEEFSLIAAGVLLKADRKASASILIRPDGTQSGVVVFPKEDTIVTFAIDTTHPPLKGVAILDDNAIMSIIVMQAAENSWRRSISKMPFMSSEHDVDVSVRLALEKTETARRYSPENTAIDGFRAMVEAGGKIQKKQMAANRIKENAASLLEDITRAGGISVKRFLRSRIPGMSQEEVETRVKELADQLQNAIEGNGAIEDETDPLHEANIILAELVRVKLPQAGLSDSTLRTIIRYVDQKLNNS